MAIAVAKRTLNHGATSIGNAAIAMTLPTPMAKRSR
jgi:hypothetical protein